MHKHTPHDAHDSFNVHIHLRACIILWPESTVCVPVHSFWYFSLSVLRANKRDVAQVSFSGSRRTKTKFSGSRMVVESNRRCRCLCVFYIIFVDSSPLRTFISRCLLCNNNAWTFGSFPLRYICSPFQIIFKRHKWTRRGKPKLVLECVVHNGVESETHIFLCMHNAQNCACSQTCVRAHINNRI